MRCSQTPHTTVRVLGPMLRTRRKIVRSQIPSVARCVMLM